MYSTTRRKAQVLRKKNLVRNNLQFLEASCNVGRGRDRIAIKRRRTGGKSMMKETQRQKIDFSPATTRGEKNIYIKRKIKNLFLDRLKKFRRSAGKKGVVHKIDSRITGIRNKLKKISTSTSLIGKEREKKKDRRRPV